MKVLFTQEMRSRATQAARRSASALLTNASASSAVAGPEGGAALGQTDAGRQAAATRTRAASRRTMGGSFPRTLRDYHNSRGAARPGLSAMPGSACMRSGGGDDEESAHHAAAGRPSAAVAA